MANRKITQEEFISRCTEIHKGKYDYSKTEYKGFKERICVTCPEHGDFWTTAQVHLSGAMCPKCKFEKQKIGLNEFIRRSIAIHSNKYDYSKVEYQNNSTKVCIICPIHGEFWQRPNDHLRGYGCAKCFNKKRRENRSSTREQFIDKSIAIHGNKYDYSKVVYVNSKAKVCIICPEHGEFWQSPSKHLCGQGCPACKNQNAGNQLRKTQKDFLEEAKNKHGDTFDYSQVEYKNAKTPIKIICPIHGVFEQTPCMHLASRFGCPKCAIVASRKLVCGVGINDIFESTNERYYTIWRAMLSRCYSEYAIKKYPTYKGCEVCDEWKRLSNFKRWFEEHYVEGWQLDKDIIKKGNRVYSPQTCCFVPSQINTALTSDSIINYRRGVFKHGGYYRCRVGKDCSLLVYGPFNTYEEALEKYIIERESYIHELAERYKEGLSLNAYKVLLNYKMKD